MTLRAKIAKLTAPDATVRIPYAGQQFTVAELNAQNATFSAEDYALVRQALGGGKRGRVRARELLPLECPACECRLTHFEPARRRPYFAASVSSPAHGEACERGQTESRDGPAVETAVEPPLAEAAAAAVVRPCRELEASSEHDFASAPPELPAPALYRIADTATDHRESPVRTPADGAQREQHEPLRDDVRVLSNLRGLLTEALDGYVPLDSQVLFRGEHYSIVSAAELHRCDDGELVAVYGRICDASWSARSGRLTLISTPETVQIWATAAVPRSVLGARFGDAIEPPAVHKPVPFIALGRLKKLAAVCGVPVIRQEFLELLRPLELATEARPPRTPTRSQSDLTDELDALLEAPWSAQPTRFASAEAAIVQAFSPPG